MNGNHYQNPWKLTPREVDAMDAMVKHYCAKRAADAIDVTDNTLRDHVRNVGGKMKSRGNIIQKYLLWDRFRQKQKREQVVAATESN